MTTHFGLGRALKILVFSILAWSAVVRMEADGRQNREPSEDQDQNVPDPVQLLREANDRMKAIDWLAFDFDYVGMFTMAGTARGRAVVAPGSSLLDVSFVADLELGMRPNGTLHLPRRSTMALTDGKAYLLDPAARTAETGTLRGGGQMLLRASNTFLIPMFMRSEPFGIEIEMPVEHRWTGRAEVHGVLCDVIFLRFPDGSPMGQQYFYLGVEDRLVRRLIFLGPGPAGSPDPVMFEVTARNLRSGSGAPPRAFTPEIPSSWSVEDHDLVSAAVGAPAPDWALKTPSGETVSAANLRGKIVVLDFWASWCPFCRQNLPLLADLTRDMRDKPVEVYAVHVWDEGDPVAYLKSRGVDLDVLMNGDALAEALKVPGTPAAIVIGPDGRILHRARTTGKARDEALRKVIADALSTGK